MDFYLPNGATKVSVFHVLYFTDVATPASLVLEYSTDAYMGVNGR